MNLGIIMIIGLTVLLFLWIIFVYVMYLIDRYKKKKKDYNPNDCKKGNHPGRDEYDICQWCGKYLGGEEKDNLE